MLSVHHPPKVLTSPHKSSRVHTYGAGHCGGAGALARLHAVLQLHPMLHNGCMLQHRPLPERSASLLQECELIRFAPGLARLHLCSNRGLAALLAASLHGGDVVARSDYLIIDGLLDPHLLPADELSEILHLAGALPLLETEKPDEDLRNLVVLA